MYKEKYVNNDIIDVPLTFYDIDDFNEFRHIVYSKNYIDDKDINNKEKYIVQNGHSTPSFDSNIYDSYDVASKRFCNMNEKKLVKSLYKENYLNNDVRNIPFNYHRSPSKTVDLTDMDESKLIKYLYNTHEVKNNKETFVKNDIPLSYYHVSDNQEKHLEYKESYDNNDLRDVPLTFYHIKNFDEQKYINYY